MTTKGVLRAVSGIAVLAVGIGLVTIAIASIRVRFAVAISTAVGILCGAVATLRGALVVTIVAPRIALVALFEGIAFCASITTAIAIVGFAVAAAVATLAAVA
jgi:hypothetical protein